MQAGSLMLLALVYLTAGVVSVPIAKRLGLGSVLGYLMAGAVIGPFALHLVGDQTGVMHFAEFGVVIMLWKLRGVFFGLGGSQVLATGLALAGAGLACGLDWRSAVALGFILALSSTAIVLQTFEEKGLMHTAAGSAAFGILLFQDVSTIPMFAALPLLTMGSGAAPAPEHGILAGFPAWMQALAILAAVMLIIVAGRYLTRPAFRFIAATRSREIFTASALLLVIAVALLMEAVGLSPALGAFLAGVVLADSEFRRELEGDIEPFRGLLLGLFFISIGASIDLRLALAQPLLLAAFVIGLMAIKTVVIYIVARVFHVEG
ncbi:MAG: cation:proton antiporter domain-containing protein, partial [Pollutimonas bauzanensis]